MAEEKKDGPKKKCPTALNRMKQSKETNLRNNTYKSRVRTAVLTFESALKEK